MTLTPEQPEQTPINPYAAAQSTDNIAAAGKRRRPDLGETIGFIIIGLGAAGLAFFATCVGGLILINSALNDSSLAVLIFACFGTSIAAFGLAFWGVRKLFLATRE